MITFWVLAFALTWIVWVPRALGQDWAVTAGTAWTWMPALAAAVVAAWARVSGARTPRSGPVLR